MNRLTSSIATQRTRTFCIVGALFLLTGCQSNDDSVDHSPLDHYRLLTQVGETTQHLKIDFLNSGLDVKVAEGDLANTVDDEAGWKFRGDAEYRLSSISRWLGGINRLAVPEDGATLTPTLADSGLDNSSVQWQLIAMPEGGCIINNELLGSELALTINTSTDPFSVEMMGIETGKEGQRWRLDPYGDVDLALSERCR